jgi:two-component system LytT family response regulator
MNVVIADDVELAREHLRHCLAGRADVVVVGEASNGKQALALCETLRPDALFLDIDMPQADGFEVAQRAPACPVVFVSAHSQYAVGAFDLEAVDFVLKPYSRGRIDRAVERLQSRQPTRGPSLLVPERGGARRVPVEQITRFYAVDKYVGFLSGGRELLVRDSLDALEQRFAALGFLRVHRGELVRLQAIKELRADRAVLQDGQEMSVSRRALPELRRSLRALSE